MSGQVKQINNAIYGKLNTQQSTKAARNVVTSRLRSETTDGQTVIDLGFSVEVGVTSDNFLLFINGISLTEGDDFSFTNLTGTRSNQVTLASPAVDGMAIDAILLNISVSQISALELTAIVDGKMDRGFVADGFQDYIVKSKIDAPHTEISGREQIDSGLETVFGIERIMLVDLIEQSSEFGPNNQVVYKPSNDNRIRFVGGDWVAASSTFGTYVQMNDPTNFVEITFYGTGLNILTIADNVTNDVRITIDGGVEGANILASVSPASAVLNARNYKTNQMVSAVSGLSLGWHTIKLRPQSNFLTLYGIEILNEVSQVSIESGVAYGGGLKQDITSSLTSNYKPAAMGTSGGRVVKYLLDGQAFDAYTENTTPAYLGSTDHSNEELVRAINFREFGANRADDFSTLAGTLSSRVFTLDDGTTTLAGQNVHDLSTPDSASVNGTNDFITLTFVGTGLSIKSLDLGTGTLRTHSVTVDGVNVGSITESSAVSGRQVIRHICSGLPYGTHTVKLLCTTSTGSRLGFMDFLIYQPKKPSIPTDAVEVADYNVMADFVANSDADVNTVATGVLRKTNAREMIYGGSGWSITGPDFGRVSGHYIRTFTAGAAQYAEYTFFGTGFEYRFEAATDAGTETLSIDGSNDFSAYTTSVYSDTAGVSFTPATGVLDSQATSQSLGAGLSVSGLPLGLHTLRIENTAGALRVDCLDIITPIHINNPSLKVGNQSLVANTNTQPIVKDEKKIDMQKAKAWIIYDQSTNTIIDSHNVAQAIDLSAGDTAILWDVPFKRVPALSLGQELERVMLRKINDQNIGLRDTHGVAIVSRNSAGAAQDSQYVAVVAYGELVTE